MQKKLIDLHKEWCETGALPNEGLCNSIPDKYEKYFELLFPTRIDKEELDTLGLSNFYWASGLMMEDFKKKTTYTPLRQTTVLLICAMHNEI